MDRAEPDEWLIDAARQMGHAIPARARTPGTTAWRVLLNAGIGDDEVLRIACTVSGADPADFTQASPACASLLSHGLAIKHRVVPLGLHRGALAVATANPMNRVLERELSLATKHRVHLRPAGPAEIIRAQGIVYGTSFGTTSGLELKQPIRTPKLSAPHVLPMLPVEAPAAPTAPRVATPAQTPAQAPTRVPTPVEAATPAPASRPTPSSPSHLVNELLLGAAAERASEVILEPQADGGALIRLCVDGVMHDHLRIDDVQLEQMIGALKERAGLDIDESRRAQEGRAAFDTPSGRVSMRVSIELVRELLATPRERIVMRLFAAYGLHRVADLGLSASEQQHVGELLSMTSGLVIVAGPTQAGKTATLYAAARELRERGRQVATIEEQIEQSLDGTTQLQLRGSTVLTLGAALRGITADAEAPPVIVTDATLDASTIEQCAKSTGDARLVIASIRTPDLASTLAHLRALHPEGAVLAAVLHGVVVQRLLRRLCTCAATQQEDELPAEQRRLLGELPIANVRRPVGCPACHSTGYAGRLAIAQVVPVTSALRGAMARRAPSTELVHLARDAERSTLWDSGMQHVVAGTTSLAELLERVSPPETGDAAPKDDIDAMLAQLLDGASKKARTAKKAAAPPAPKPARPPVRAAATKSARRPVRLRVLLALGDTELRSARARELAQATFTVIEAADGPTTLELVKRVRADIVLTELAMPGLDAFGLLNALAERKSAAVVVVLTPQADEAMDGALTNAGARAVLRRDLGATELAKSLRELAPA